MNNLIYQRAERFLPWNLQHIVLNSTIFPYWTADAVYYFQEAATNKLLVRIDIRSGNKEEILNFRQLLDALSSQVKHEVNSSRLPLDKFSIEEKPLQLRFSYQKTLWVYDLEKNICTQGEDIKLDELKSPDQNWVLQIKNHNLFLKDLIYQQGFKLTSDGEAYYDYASSPETNTCTVSRRIEGIAPSPVAVWATDSSKIITHKLDQRKVNHLFLLQNSPDKSQRPELHSYRMSFAGDKDLPLAELILIDVATKSITPLKTEAFLSPYLTPIEFKWVWWSQDNSKVYFLREKRAAKELTLCVADAITGVTEVLITETANTYIEPNQHFPCPPQVIVLEDGKGIIWLSERSGYPHLYLYETNRDALKSVITKGEWAVREVHFYDAETNWLYFTACGYTEGVDPYFKQLLRCRLDGTNIQCLTEENANHTICISPQKNCFLDTYSTIATAPVSVLKKMDGTVICHVETADISGLKELGWKPPLRFSEKGRDGVTNIFGNLYFPSNFDPNKKYPIIDHIYPGPQFYRTPTHFNIYGAIFRSAWIAQAMAELGFIVIHVDGFGTPGRSKTFHDATYQNISDCGIPDHVLVIKQLAEKYNFIDLEKVGITGYSGGGYAATRAMLEYPDFYKVAVSAAGNHDLRCYPASYGEKYNGLDVDAYAHQSNAVHAEKLQGKLLLIHGEMDDNVHPCATMQLVDALIKHNKDFDMLIMPNQNHNSTFDHPYYIRRLWDYFVQNLQGQRPSGGYLVSPMPLDFPQINDW